MSAQVWDLNPVLNEASPAGELLKALFGYNGNPALIEVVGYLAYWLVALLGGRWWVTWRSARLVPAAAAG
jgi:high-affinity Fe2+/Pb2+ permease